MVTGGAAQFFAATRHGFGRPGGTTENSPALECWVRGDATHKSRRDDRVIGKLGRPSLAGLGSSPIADPALKCWAIFTCPCGTAGIGRGVAKNRDPPSCRLIKTPSSRPANGTSQSGASLSEPCRQDDRSAAFRPQKRPPAATASKQSDRLPPPTFWGIEKERPAIHPPLAGRTFLRPKGRAPFALTA